MPCAAINIDGLDGQVWRALKKPPMAFSDENGAFALGGLPDGLVTLTAKRDAALSQKVEVALVPSGVHTVRLQLNDKSGWFK